MTALLIIDDDERFSSALTEFFARYNLNLKSAIHPDTGLDLLNNQHFDLLILDVMLPDKDGFEVCKIVRKKNDIPIIMLTARGEVMDRVEGLELGADDYLSKPFEPRELVARIQNILRRTEHDRRPKSIIQFENIQINQETQTVVVCEKAINLTSNEYRLLILFATHPGQKLSRDDIAGKLKGTDIEFFSRAVDIQISRLRQKIKPTDYIQTVWGEGYQFTAPQMTAPQS